jgi:hypothetical protein
MTTRSASIDVRSTGDRDRCLVVGRLADISDGPLPLKKWIRRMFRRPVILLVTAVSFAAPMIGRADVVTEWNLKSAQFTVAGRLSPPDAWNVLATTGVSVSDALAAISGKSPPLLVKLNPSPDTSIEAAAAAASHAVLLKMIPGQQEGIEAAYQAALAKIPDNPSKQKGIALGSQAAQEVLRARPKDQTVESYRPFTTAGKYVPTTLPVSLTVALRKPWVLDSCDQFRPGPPPALDSTTWARDYNEIKALGARFNSQRTPEQTEMALFWEATNPIVHLPLAHSVAEMPGRDPMSNARLLAILSMSATDALGAVFDAKYTYNFWRPVTAIRNGDIDGNDATEREASWVPLIDTPMHPEYPCAHCIVSGTIGTLLKTTLAGTPSPKLMTSSPTAPDKPRSWANPDEFMAEVALARIYDGVHYRTSTEVGTAMGIKIAEFAASKHLR